jgi:hypothetical protein
VNATRRKSLFQTEWLVKAVPSHLDVIADKDPTVRSPFVPSFLIIMIRDRRTRGLSGQEWLGALIFLFFLFLLRLFFFLFNRIYSFNLWWWWWWSKPQGDSSASYSFVKGQQDNAVKLEMWCPVGSSFFFVVLLTHSSTPEDLLRELTISSDSCLLVIKPCPSHHDTNDTVSFPQAVYKLGELRNE